MWNFGGWVDQDENESDMALYKTARVMLRHSRLPCGTRRLAFVQRRFGCATAVQLRLQGRATNSDSKCLSVQQAEESLSNVKDLVREDVETAYIEVQRSRQQVDATAATLLLQEEKLRAETAKFRVGKSTALLVATAQRDLVASQVAEVEAVINYLKALTTLFLIDGSLLERRGISAPGQTGVRVVPGAE